MCSTGITKQLFSISRLQEANIYVTSIFLFLRDTRMPVLRYSVTIAANVYVTSIFLFLCDMHTQCCVFTAVSISPKSFFAANITVRSQKRKDISLFLSSLIIYFSLIILNDFLPLPSQLPFLFPSTFTCVSKDSVV